MSAFEKFIDILTRFGLEYFGLYYSKYRAFVVSNEDPEGLSRLKLLIPHIDDKKPLQRWVAPCGVFGGLNYGVQVLPQKGDTVYVEFEKGKLSDPLWSHGYFGKDEKPKDRRNPKQFYFISPGGHEVLIDDEKNTLKVSVKNGPSFYINKDTTFIGKDDSKKQPMVLGNELTNLLDKQDEKIMGIIQAIKSAAVAPGDGGATFKSSLITALEQYTKADTSPIISKINNLE